MAERRKKSLGGPWWADHPSNSPVGLWLQLASRHPQQLQPGAHKGIGRSSGSTGSTLISWPHRWASPKCFLQGSAPDPRDATHPRVTPVYTGALEFWQRLSVVCGGVINEFSHGGPHVCTLKLLGHLSVARADTAFQAKDKSMPTNYTSLVLPVCACVRRSWA